MSNQTFLKVHAQKEGEHLDLSLLDFKLLIIPLKKLQTAILQRPIQYVPENGVILAYIDTSSSNLSNFHF